MNVTFMIGNGFDLACGLKTRYADMYNEFYETQSDNKTLENFKSLLKAEQKTTWSDFEMALPAFGKKLNDFEKFKECVNEFTQFMTTYLIQQEVIIDFEAHEEQLAESMSNYIYNFDSYCLRQSKNLLNGLINSPNEHTTYNFITFNYTKTLEKCLYYVKKKPKANTNLIHSCIAPIHIHATLDEGILVGLDDEKYYSEIPCPDIRKLKNFLDKLHNNNETSGIVEQTKTVLNSSNIIVIFGWSMGDSDSFWVNEIKGLFKRNPKFQLVYMPYHEVSTDFNIRYIPLDREVDGKDTIMKKFEIDEHSRSRVHIIVNSGYMDFRFLNSQTTQSESESNEKKLSK